MKMIKNDYNHTIKNADNLLEILCLATLISSKTIRNDSNIDDAKGYFARLPDQDCSNCPVNNICLSCILES